MSMPRPIDSAHAPTAGGVASPAVRGGWPALNQARLEAPRGSVARRGRALRRDGSRPSALPALVALVGVFATWSAAPTAQAQQAELLPPVPGRLQAPPPEVRAKESLLIDQVLEPELVFQLEPTRSVMLRTKLPVTRVAITHPEVLEINQFSPQDFEFIGKRGGETTLSLWFLDNDRREVVIRYLVRVAPSRIDEERAELEYGHLQDRLNEMFPNSQIQLIPVLDKLIVRGQARDAEEATQIMTVLRGQSTNQVGAFARGGFLNPAAGGQVARLPGAQDLPTTNIVNMLTVPGEQQVMLKVRIAELTRTAARELGVDFSVLKPSFSISHAISGGGNLSAILDAGDIELFIRAVSSNGNGKILAEPTLVTLSGHTATFIAGGEFAVPTAVGVDGIGAATTTFRGFGTQLSFTPTVLDKDRLRLHVTPSFSSLNNGNAVNGIPGLNTRAVSTTVDLREGQWLAIAGLIQDQQGGTRARLPFIGDIPIVGGVFGRQEVRREETELVVLVSPELVHPLEEEQLPGLLPGMDLTEPTDLCFFFGPSIEGRPEVHHRSTVWPAYQQRIHEAVLQAKKEAKMSARYERQQQKYVRGPHGFSR